MTFTVNQHDDVIGNTVLPQAYCTLRGGTQARRPAATTRTTSIVLEGGSYTVNSQLGPLAVSPNATRITLRGAGASATIDRAAARDRDPCALGRNATPASRSTI